MNTETSIMNNTNLKTMTDMNTYTYNLTVSFHVDKSFEIHLPQDVFNTLLGNGIIDEGKTKGSYGANTSDLTVAFKPYAPADPAKALVKKKTEIGAFTNVEELKTKIRITSALPKNLTNEQAQRLYEEDARLVAEGLAKGLYKPLPMVKASMTVVTEEVKICA
jgi:hypothetical protein